MKDSCPVQPVFIRRHNLNVQNNSFFHLQTKKAKRWKYIPFQFKQNTDVSDGIEVVFGFVA